MTRESEDNPVLPVWQEHDIPDSIRGLSSIADPDYADLFIMTTADASNSSPEQWARAAFEDVAGLGGQFIFRVLLGMRLEWRRSPDNVAGWKISDRQDKWIRLEAHSRIVTGNLVVKVDEQQVLLATFMRYHRPLGRRIWSRLSVKHRQLAPGLLRDSQEVLRQKSR